MGRARERPPRPLVADASMVPPAGASSFVVGSAGLRPSWIVHRRSSLVGAAPPGRTLRNPLCAGRRRAYGLPGPAATGGHDATRCSDLDPGLHPPHDAGSGPRPLVKGLLRLPDDVPLAILRGGDALAREPSLRGLGVATVGDVMRLRADDLAGDDGRLAAGLARVLVPWVDPPCGPGSGPYLLEGDYPEWFDRVPLSELRLPNLMGDVLAPCVDIGGLRVHPAAILARVDGLGTTAPLRLRKRVESAFARLSQLRPEARYAHLGADAPAPYDLAEPFLSHVERHLHLLDERDAQVLCARLGITGAGRSLRELASDLGVTPERVRQVQGRSLRRIDDATGCMGIITAALERRRPGLPFLVGEALAEAWTAGMPMWLFESLIHRCAGYHLVALSPDAVYVCGHHEAPWADARAKLLGLLAESPPGTSADAVLERLGRLVPRDDLEGCMALAGLLLAGRDSSTAMAGLGMWRELVASLLPEDGKVTLDESWGRIEHLAAGGLTRRRFEDHLRTHALNVGGGLFARCVRVEVDAGTIQACDEILRSGAPGRRWSTEEIHRGLVSRGADRDMDVVSLELMLCAANRFNRTRARLWWHPDAPQSAPDVNMLAERVLEERGGPMPVGELTRETFERWGSRKFRQLNLKGRLVLVDRGVWGLADRDIGIAPSTRTTLVGEALEAIAKGAALLGDVFAAVEPSCLRAGVANRYLLGTLLRLDAGIGLGCGGAIRAPRQVPALRPGSMKEAVLLALNSKPGGSTRAEISHRVAAVTGKVPSDPTLSAALRGFGRRVERGLWVARGDMPDMAAPVERRTKVGTGGLGRPRKKPKPPKPKGYPTTRKSAVPSVAFDWTEEREALLRAMASQGRSSFDIRQALGGGITKNAVIAKCHRMGLSKPRQRRDA